MPPLCAIGPVIILQLREGTGIEMKENSMTTIQISMTKNTPKKFSSIFGRGVKIPTRVGHTIKDVVCGQIGISEDYLDQRIQTIFHNGKSVDDVETTVVKDGSAIALSAAMPGLMGATLRKGGFFSPMRSQISHQREETAVPEANGMIMLKLFNLLVGELGALVLGKGVFIGTDVFLDFLNRQSAVFFSEIKSIKVDGNLCRQEELLGMDWKTEEMFLQVVFED
jgi:hypothetical protein